MANIKAEKRYVLFGDCTRPTVVVYCRRFGTTYRSCRQLSNCLAFEDGTFRLFEMSVRNCHPRLRNIPGKRASYLHRGGTLKSCKVDEALVTYDATNHIPFTPDSETFDARTARWVNFIQINRRHLSLSRPNLIQSMPPHPTS